MRLCVGWAVLVAAKSVLFARDSKIAENQLPSGMSPLVVALQSMVDVTILCHSVRD
jgi:hypothetical protein